MWTDKLYDRAPIPLQNLMVSVKGWSLHQVRYRGRSHEEFRRTLVANESRSLDELRASQFADLKAFVGYCFRHSPYYRATFEARGLGPDDLRRPDDLARLPILPKQDLRAHTERFFTEPIRSGMVAVHTSGTTGSPVTVHFSAEDIGRRFAFLDRCRRWAGVGIGQRRASFTGRSIVPIGQVGPPFWRVNHPGRQLLFSSYHLSLENLPAYVRALIDYQPEIIDGYPSAIHIVAEQILRSGDAGRVRPQAILVSAETVLPHQRAAIESAFQAKVFNQYASSEGAPFVSECREGALHVHLDSGVIEVLRPDGSPASEGETGAMVVTSFTTHITPLLRYAIGDTAGAGSDAPCPCGLPFPTFQAITGRVDDILHTPDRGYVGRLDTVFKELPNSIIEAQIVQTAPDRIVLRFVPDPERYQPGHADVVVAEMRKRLGQVVGIDTEEVPHIARSANGKMRPVVNECAAQLPEQFRYGQDAP